MGGPLTGVRVIDLTTVISGPYGTQIMGDMGADVVKVESHAGDIMRHPGPAASPGMGAAYMGCNRNKRSLVLDLKDPRGLEALKRLTRTADVFVHNMRIKAAKRLGIDYDALARINDRLIYCVIAGFGTDGPYGDRPAYDDVVQGMSGVAATQGGPGGEPQFIKAIVADKTAGLASFGVVAAALYHRERTGRGQYVEVPMFETMVSFNYVENLAGYTFDPPKGGAGYDRLTTPFRRPHKTADGYIAALPYSAAHWRRFFAAAGRPDLAEDPRLATGITIARHVGELYAELAAILETRPTAEWLDLLERIEIPCGPINGARELLEDEHLAAVGFFALRPHPSEGPVRVMRSPYRFSETANTIDRLAPRIGEHSVEILGEAGYGAAEIDELIEAGVTSDGTGGKGASS
jgi:crotonobetainyl-CoA:carnitine CoA-transferase CaiB-like acyl-CoA transferase